METFKTPSEYSVDFNRGFQEFSMANLETGNVLGAQTNHLTGSNEPSHWDGSFEYPQHLFWLRNKKIIFLLYTLN